MALSSLTKSSYHKFSLQDITKATGYFHKNKIYRDDKDWTEYLVNISYYDVKSNNKVVKGKVIVRNFKENTNAEFMKEVRTVRRNELKPNQNLTPLLGYCTEAGKKILVYKYTEVAVAQPSHELDLVIAPLPREFSYDDAILALSSASYRQFSLGEIGTATSNFNSNSIIRSEAEFSEYVANISSYDFKLNVKHFHENTGYFEKEVAVLAFLEVHPNLISLIGYCIESNEKILVYKSPENGRLVDGYKDEEGCSVSFSLKMRLNICLEVAYGLQHLHKRTNKFPFGIVYRDMFLENILLDKNWAPIYSNFGGSEFGIDENFSKASDVQRFGRFLISMLCKDSMQNIERCYENEENFNFAVWTQQNVDISIIDDISDGSLKLFGDLIGKCCQEEKLLLATMDEVVLDLDAVIKCQNVTYGDLVKSSLRESRIMGGVTEELDQLNDLNLNKIISISSSSSFSSSSSSSLNLLARLYRRFSLGDIKEVTNNLDKEKVLTNGQDWNEYLVQMNLDGKTERTWATVKHFKDYCSDVFKQEIKMMTKIQEHPNLISLLGYCIESGESFLVYNYTEFSSLLDYVKEGSQIHLSWKERLNICLGAAYGLQHIHKATDEFRNGLIHGDIDLANILLDKDWVAKVSNIGGCHVAQLSSPFSKTIAKDQWTRYAPEFVKSNRLTAKVDVYAFGIVLFQFLCRQRISEEWDESNLEFIEESFARWANCNIDIAKQDGLSHNSLKGCTDCIGRCLESNPFKRSNMDLVVHDLETALSFLEYDDEQINFSPFPRSKSRIMDVVAMSGSSFSLSSSSCRQFRLDEIREATNEFDMKKCLGKGGEGTVYLAELYLDSTSQKSQVAVKRINKGLIGEFEKEITTVSKIQHPNLVSLLGYCKESEEKILVYEYMGKGSLSDYLKMKSPSLSWKQRLKICLDAAYGLQHLHRPTTEFSKGIIHRDMKPENILIDNNWVAKVSDFGMVKLSKVDQDYSTMITLHAKGTPGYFAPETHFFSESQLSRKIDVYAFGCVMYEVLCRKKRPVEQSVYVGHNEDVGLLADENVDPKIIDQISEESKIEFIETIVACLQIDSRRRPTMDEVVHKLESALNCQEQSEKHKEFKAVS